MTVLRDAIRELLDKADKWRDKGINEANTKALLIEPMLGVLGWDVHDLEVVSREYRVFDGTHIDYALKLGNTPRLFIEAKPLGKSLDDNKLIAQTVNYANNEGVVWAVLTDGVRYRVYKSNEPADMERKLLFDIDLRDARGGPEAEEAVRKLTFLSRDSIELGSLDECGESTFTDVRVKSVVMGLLSSPSTRVVNMVLDKLGGGTALPRDKVRDSLRRLATLLSGNGGASTPAVPRQPVSDPAPQVSTPPKPPSGWTPLDRVTVVSHQAAPSQIRLPGGNTLQLRVWKDLLVQVVIYLVETGALGSQHCPVRLPRATKRVLVHTEARHPNGASFAEPVHAGKLWVETHANARQLHHEATFLIRHAGLNPRDFQVL